MKINIVLIMNKGRHLIAGLLILIGTSVLLYGLSHIYKTEQVSFVPLADKVVLLDPGHGGIDAGASDNGAVEKKLNLDIALILKSYIESNGGVCYLTRTEDTNTADPNRAKGITQKSSDLKTRKDSISKLNADIFISIHMNKFSQSQYFGLQVFYDPNSQESKKLGEAIQNSAKNVLDSNNHRKAKATGDKIYVLKGNSIPSALVECGFLSNPAEAEKLQSSEYQQKVAWSIFLGITEYFSH